MKELRFDAPLPWTDKSLYDWFRDLVGGVAFIAGDGLSNCCSAGRLLNIYYPLNVSTKVT